MSEAAWKAQIDSGQRFEFGRNWRRYADLINEQRVSVAVESLSVMLKLTNLSGKKFLDIGCGSGLFSLAAARLGAEVISFDFDPNSVQCAKSVAQKFGYNAANWVIEEGSILNPIYVENLKQQHGLFDIVYSWGVLHHTGSMWRALEASASLVKPNGKLFIAIYNDQGFISKIWRVVKRSYCVLPRGLRWLITVPAFFGIWVPGIVSDLLRGRGVSYKLKRGMSSVYDLIDWIGGYPFEVATPESIVSFHQNKGFVLDQLKTVGRQHGCCEYVFHLAE